jgi:hypothetical protein
VKLGSGTLVVILIGSLKRSALAIEMVLSGLITEHEARVGAAEGVSFSRTPYA